MKITFLGTGTSQGVPIIACNCNVCSSNDLRDKRLRSSVLIEDGSTALVIDTGPDFRQQMLRTKLKKLDAILFTHEHKDHTAGLDDIRAFNYLSGKAMDVFAESRVQEALKREFAYAFAENKYPGVPKIEFHAIENKPFNIDNLNIQPIRALHGKLPILGFRINTFAYLTDINFIAPNQKQLLYGCTHLVVGGLRKEKHVAHFNFAEAIELINEIGPQTGYITHISHQSGLYADLQKELPAGICLAYDGLVIEL